MSLPFPLPLDTSRQSSFTTPLRLLLATTAALWLGTAQPQASTPVVSRQVTELRFRDFFRTPTGLKGLDMSDTLRQSDGQQTASEPGNRCHARAQRNREQISDQPIGQTRDESEVETRRHLFVFGPQRVERFLMQRRNDGRRSSNGFGSHGGGAARCAKVASGRS